jgi:hypothetical protein
LGEAVDPIGVRGNVVNVERKITGNGNVYVEGLGSGEFFSGSRDELNGDGVSSGSANAGLGEASPGR